MRHSLVPVALLLASLIALASLHQVDSTRVDCEGDTCEVILDGHEASEQVFGQTVDFWGSDGDVALLGHRGLVLGCKQGQVIDSGNVTITCEAVGSEIVRAEFTRNGSNSDESS